MSKKIILVLSIIIFFCGFKLARAEVIINEVQIGGVCEFIELRGNSSDSLTGFSIKKISSTGTISSLVVSDRLKEKMFQSDYFLITNGDDCGVTADAAWPQSYALAKDNSIVLYKDGLEIETISWGDIEIGKSTQKQGDDTWKICSPTTPGSENNSCDSGGGNPPVENGDPAPSDTTESSSSGSSGTSTKGEEKVIINPTIKAKILVKTIAFVGLPLDIENSVLGYSNEIIRCGRYFWNFGDGDSLETTNSEKFSHTYFYPGEYTITLDYYLSTSFLTGVPDATNKITVKVAPLTVSISNVGDEKDFFVELTNNSDYDTDISKWTLTSFNRIFLFPRNSVIPTKKKIILSPKITGFSVENKKDLKLITSSGDIAFDYNFSSEPIVITKKVSKIIKTTTENINNNPIVNTITPETQIPVENLGASPMLSNQNSNSKDANLLWFGLAIFLGVGASSVYFLRRGRNNRSTQVGSDNRSGGDDFSILDE